MHLLVWPMHTHHAHSQRIIAIVGRTHTRPSPTTPIYALSVALLMIHHLGKWQTHTYAHCTLPAQSHYNGSYDVRNVCFAAGDKQRNQTDRQFSSFYHSKSACTSRRAATQHYKHSMQCNLLIHSDARYKSNKTLGPKIP